MKRALDFTLSVSALLLLAPLLAIVGLAVWLFMGSPIIFRQTRIGLHEAPFQIAKLRTMVDLYDTNGLLLPDHMRLTKTGSFIRKTSLDELPQLWNVLRGEMSLVGPRPLLPEYLPRYTNLQRLRHQVLPGITGWAQINGRNALTWEQKFDLDIWYVDRHGFWLDIRILCLTLWHVVRREGISQQGHATMDKFMGTGIAERHG
jgi:sugar transferase EpsL